MDKADHEAAAAIDLKTVDGFAREGAVVLRGLFTTWIETLRTGTAAVMAKPSPLERTYHPKDGSARFFQDLCNWQRIPQYRDFVMHSPAARAAARLMRSGTAQFFHDHVLVKEPGSSIPTPWHQDMPYYCVGGPHTVSFWIPLDPVPFATSLQCVAGSHLWGVNHRPKRFDGTDLYEGDDAIEMPDIDANRTRYTILQWELEPGDAVAFDFRTVHGATGNQGQANRRRVFSARWVGDGTVFVDRKGRGSPPFRHLALRSGDALVGPDFPVVYPAA